MKCPYTRSGAHRWKVKRTTRGVLGTETQYRICEKCGYKEYLQTDLLTGRKKWKP